MFRTIRGFPGGAVVKNLSANAEYRRLRFNLWVGKIPWSRNGNSPQYSCLENSMDRGALQSTGSQDQMQLSSQALFRAGQSESMAQARSPSHRETSSSQSFQDWVFQWNHEDIKTWVLSLFLIRSPQLSSLGDFPPGRHMATTVPDITPLPTHVQKEREDLILSCPAWLGTFFQQISSDDPLDRSWASLAAREAGMHMFFTFSHCGGRWVLPSGTRVEHGMTKSLLQGLIYTGQYCESTSTCWERNSLHETESHNVVWSLSLHRMALQGNYSSWNLSIVRFHLRPSGPSQGLLLVSLYIFLCSFQKRFLG